MTTSLTILLSGDCRFSPMVVVGHSDQASEAQAEANARGDRREAAPGNSLLKKKPLLL
jgi:hypothetical protein